MAKILLSGILFLLKVAVLSFVPYLLKFLYHSRILTKFKYTRARKFMLKCELKLQWIKFCVGTDGTHGSGLVREFAPAVAAFFLIIYGGNKIYHDEAHGHRS